MQLFQIRKTVFATQFTDATLSPPATRAQYRWIRASTCSKAALLTLITCVLCTIAAGPVQAQNTDNSVIHSDVLLALDADGEHYNVQWTLSVAGDALDLTLPRSTGPVRVNRIAHENSSNPDTSGRNATTLVGGELLSISNATAIIRYRAALADTRGFNLSRADDQRASLEVPVVLPSLVERTGVHRLAEVSVSWWLPELYQVTGYSGINALGQWKETGNMVFYTATNDDRSGVANDGILRLSYRIRGLLLPSASNVASASTGSSTADAVSANASATEAAAETASASTCLLYTSPSPRDS